MMSCAPVAPRFNNIVGPLFKMTALLWAHHLEAYNGRKRVRLLSPETRVVLAYWPYPDFQSAGHSALRHLRALTSLAAEEPGER